PKSSRTRGSKLRIIRQVFLSWIAEGAFALHGNGRARTDFVGPFQFITFGYSTAAGAYWPNRQGRSAPTKPLFEQGRIEPNTRTREEVTRHDRAARSAPGCESGRLLDRASRHGALHADGRSRR